MSILISNVFSDKNIGGAAITAATIRAAQDAFPDEPVKLVAVNQGPRFDVSHPFTMQAFPDAEIVPPLVQVKPGPLQGLRTVLRSLKIMRTLPADDRAVQTVGDAKAVISKGGYVYHERPNAKSLMALWMTAFPIALGNAMGKPTAAVCTTVGPFKTEASRRLNKYLLGRADLVVPRDEFSYQAALDLGLDPERVIHLPDIVFSYDPPSDAEAQQMAERLGVSGQRFAVLTLSKTEGGQEDFHAHEDNVRAALVSLLEAGTLDRVLVTIHSDQDIELSDAFVAEINDPRVVRVRDPFSPEQLMALYRAADVLIARRMHSAIFALVAGTPVVAFSMGGKKVQGVMGSLGLEDMLMPFPLSSPDALVERVREVTSNCEPLAARVLESVAGARSRVRKLPALLREYLVREEVVA